MFNIKCFGCGYVLGGHINATPGDKDAEPSDGSLFICAHCSQLGMVEGGGVRELTQKELREALSEMHVLKGLAAVIQARDSNRAAKLSQKLEEQLRTAKRGNG